MKNLITEEFKEKFKTAFARFMNVTIVASTLIAGFGLGYYFQELKMKPQAVNETILNKEVRIAIDSYIWSEIVPLAKSKRSSK